MKKFKYNKDNKRYVIFKRDKAGNVMGLMENSFSMSWSYNTVNIFDGIPTNYFHPQEGHFIIKTTKEYPDIKILTEKFVDRYNHGFLVKSGDKWCKICGK